MASIPYELINKILMYRGKHPITEMLIKNKLDFCKYNKKYRSVFMIYCDHLKKKHGTISSEKLNLIMKIEDYEKALIEKIKYLKKKSYFENLVILK